MNKVSGSDYEEYSAELKNELSPEYRKHLEKPASAPVNLNSRGTSDTYVSHFSLVQETDKAVLLQPNPELPNMERSKAQWIPRSQIQEIEHTGDFDTDSNESIVEVHMSTWIAQKKGWM